MQYHIDQFRYAMIQNLNKEGRTIIYGIIIIILGLKMSPYYMCIYIYI